MAMIKCRTMTVKKTGEGCTRAPDTQEGESNTLGDDRKGGQTELRASSGPRFKCHSPSNWKGLRRVRGRCREAAWQCG